MSTSATVIAEGKTKIIVDAQNAKTDDYECPTCPKVRIISKDDVTAGDGEAREILSGKAKASNQTTVNVFKLLKQHGVPTHFLSPFDDQSFIALRAEMIPLEVVTRRIATGSYLKRHPRVLEGSMFKFLEFELFYKDDSKHDPLVELSSAGDYLCLRLFPASERKEEDDAPVERIAIKPDSPTAQVNFDEIRIVALQVFLILEEAWKELGVVLYDMKIEFGLVDDGLGGQRLVVADVIDNDSWRIRDSEGNQLDKQVFRDASKVGVTEADLEKISSNYELVAKLTEQFVQTAY